MSTATATVLLLTMAITGCSGNASDTPTPSSRPSVTAPTGATPRAAASPQTKIQRGGKLRAAFFMDASSLDPHTGISGGDGWFWNAMFDTLVGLDRNYVPRPELSLAEKWEIPDPKTLIFYLRKGVKFHDGTPFNAQAVKFNIDRVLDPATKAQPRASLQVIDSVEVVDDFTAKFHLKAPSGGLLAMLGDRGGAMVSPAAIQKYGSDFGVHPVGTGPFQFVDWIKGSSVTVKRYESYWRKDKDGNQLPYLDEVKIAIIPDSTVSLANLQTGDVEVSGVDAKDLATVKRNNNLALEDFDGAGLATVLAFNLAKPPMDDINLRLAIAYAVDPETINKAVYFGDSILAKAGMWPTNTWVYKESTSRPYYDPKKAKEYLAKAGKPQGFTMQAMTYSTPSVVQQAELIAAQLAEVGIKVQLEVRDVGTASTAFFTDGSFPMYITNWSRYPEPDWVASLCYKGDGYYNAGKVKNEKLDELIAKGSASYDLEERKAIYNQINDIVFADARYIPLLYSRYHIGYNVKVQNMSSLFGGDAKGRYAELWLKQ